MMHCMEEKMQDGYKVERKRAASKLRVVKHREKVYSNPELLEEYRRKERERLEQDIFTLCV
ncbi:hypothetical protein NQZ68_009894 [Dissostichus eleginoides]|nr:hypothetical protein NQZ68_009894 [Dissostichus eleginoides]